jgi:hypothetical protein
MFLEAKLEFARLLQQSDEAQLRNLRLVLPDNARRQIPEGGTIDATVIAMFDWALKTGNLVVLGLAAANCLTHPAFSTLVDQFETSPEASSTSAPMTPSLKDYLAKFLAENFTEVTLPKVLLDELGKDEKPTGSFSVWVGQLINRYDQNGQLLLLLDVCTTLRPSPEAFVIRSELFSAHTDRSLLINNFRDAMEVLTAKLSQDHVRALVKLNRKTYEQMASGLDQLQQYKELHAILHLLQMRIPELLYAGQRFPEEMMSKKLLSPEQLGLAADVRKARTISEKLPTRLQEDSWIDDLDSIRSNLESAWKKQDAKVLREQLNLLSFLQNEMPRIDGLMAIAIYNFPVQLLISALSEVEQAIQGDDPTEALSIAQGRQALENILPRLMGLAKRHNEWQWLEKELAGIDSNRDPEPLNRVPRWDRARERLQNIWSTFAATEWAQKIKAHVLNWEEAVRQLSTPELGNDQLLRQKLLEECELEAYLLRVCTTNRFIDIDEEMREQSTELSTVSRSMTHLLQNLA